MIPFIFKGIIIIGTYFVYTVAITVPILIVGLCIYLGIERYNENHIGDTNEQKLR